MRSPDVGQGARGQTSQRYFFFPLTGTEERLCRWTGPGCEGEQLEHAARSRSCREEPVHVFLFAWTPTPTTSVPRTLGVTWCTEPPFSGGSCGLQTPVSSSFTWSRDVMALCSLPLELVGRQRAPPLHASPGETNHSMKCRVVGLRSLQIRK